MSVRIISASNLAALSRQYSAIRQFLDAPAPNVEQFNAALILAHYGNLAAYDRRYGFQNIAVEDIATAIQNEPLCGPLVKDYSPKNLPTLHRWVDDVARLAVRNIEDLFYNTEDCIAPPARTTLDRAVSYLFHYLIGDRR